MTGVSALGWSFAKAADERFVGFGERSDAVDQTGKFVENWAEEGPFSAGFARPLTEPLIGETWQGPYPVPGTNFPMPWFLSSRGYGFLLDSFAYSAFRLHRPEQWNVETREDRIRFVVFGGPTPAQALSRFVAHNGRQPPPAEWFFGPWYQPLGSADFRRELITNWRAGDGVADLYALPALRVAVRAARCDQGGNRLLPCERLPRDDLCELLRLRHPPGGRVRGRRQPGLFHQDRARQYLPRALCRVPGFIERGD
jgi:hypothetical protein